MSTGAVPVLVSVAVKTTDVPAEADVADADTVSLSAVVSAATAGAPANR
jgi:hypothetical protein